MLNNDNKYQKLFLTSLVHFLQQKKKNPFTNSHSVSTINKLSNNTQNQQQLRVPSILQKDAWCIHNVRLHTSVQLLMPPGKITK